jgi:hypothetical protein
MQPDRLAFPVLLQKGSSERTGKWFSNYHRPPWAISRLNRLSSLICLSPSATLHALTTTLLLSHIYCIDRQVSTFVLDHILNPPNLLHPSHVSRSIVTGLYKHLGSYIDSQPDASTPSCLTYSSLWIIIVERQLFQCFVHG